ISVQKRVHRTGGPKGRYSVQARPSASSCRMASRWQWLIGVAALSLSSGSSEPPPHPRPGKVVQDNPPVEPALVTFPPNGADPRPVRRHALGGDSSPQNHKHALHPTRQIQVHPTAPRGSAAPHDRRADTTPNENLLSSSAAYGLAIQAMGGAKINSSLLPQRI